MHRHSHPYCVTGSLLWRLAKSDCAARDEKGTRDRQPEGEKFHDLRSLRRRLRGAIYSKIFVDRLLWRGLKVGSGGGKWTAVPLDQWTPILNPNASMLENSGI